MKALPVTEDAVLLRADFSSDPAWQAVCAEVRQRVGIFQATATCISDPENDGLTVDRLLDAVGDELAHAFVLIADSETFAAPDHPLLVVDLWTERGRTFRAVPSTVWGLQSNLPIGNMDFSEFADAVDADGIFRGF